MRVSGRHSLGQLIQPATGGLRPHQDTIYWLISQSVTCNQRGLLQGSDLARPAGEARARILAAAHQQLRRVGADRLTIDVVAREADCAKGLVHYHYRTKEDLLAAAADALMAASERRWAGALQAPTFEAAIRQTWSVVVAEASEGVPLAWASLRTFQSKVTGQTVSNMFDRRSAGMAKALGELLEKSGLGLRASLAEVGSLLAAAVHGFEAQLASGASAESLEGGYAALWVGVLALTRPAPARNAREQFPGRDV